MKKKMRRNVVLKSLISALVLFMCGISVKAQNPILKPYADPHMKVWNGRVYVSVGLDNPVDKPMHFKMTQWDIFSSEDLLVWRHEATIYPQNTFMGEAGAINCWATDIETRNGKYYLYFSNGSFETGVAAADKPNGPYIDVLGKPLVPASYSTNQEYDPTIFTDDDNTPYLVFGMDGLKDGELLRFQIARLNDDMISFAEKSRNIIHNSSEGFMGPGHRSDGSHIHKYRGVYYLSCHGSKYMTSDNVYGPYDNMRELKLGGHPSYGEFHGQTYGFYEQGCIPYGIRWYRQSSLVYLHYRDNGDMVADKMFMQNSGQNGRPGEYYATGVGNYDAAWPKIEAEWFFSKSKEVEKRDGPSNEFMLSGIQDKSTVCFPKIAWTSENTVVKFNVKVLQPATIEIRQNDEKGESLGSIQVVPNSEWQTVSTNLKNKSGTVSLCFRIVSDSKEKEVMQFDWFSLK